jgi:hypothetical protein
MISRVVGMTIAKRGHPCHSRVFGEYLVEQAGAAAAGADDENGSIDHLTLPGNGEYDGESVAPNSRLSLPRDA